MTKDWQTPSFSFVARLLSVLSCADMVKIKGYSKRGDHYVLVRMRLPSIPKVQLRALTLDEAYEAKRAFCDLYWNYKRRFYRTIYERHYCNTLNDLK